MIPSDISFVDVETTGGSFRRDRIIDIGILRIKNGNIVDTYESLVNPDGYVPDEIQQMTGITPQDLSSAPSFRSIAEDILPLLEGSLFIAHNVSFDYGFLKSEFQRLGKTFQTPYLCTARLSRLLYPGYRRHNLDTVIERCGLVCHRRHRAFPDAQVLWNFFQHITSSFSLEAISDAISKARKSPSVPFHISPSVVESLPESCGVYIFYGEEDAPLYVGKSVHIKDRVKSHFSQHHCSSTEWKIAQQIRRIEYVKTPGELGALLKEAGMIKQMQPLYNRMLRQAHHLVIARKLVDVKGYWQVSLSQPEDIYMDDLHDCLGVFRSRRQATDFFRAAAADHHLCDRLLGLQKEKGACFGYQLDRCLGACVGKEPPLSYNARLLSAVSAKKISSWPFSSPILIKEDDGESSCGYIFDQWKYIGTVWDTDGDMRVEKEKEISFDLDVYTILKRYISQPQHVRRITPLSPAHFSQLREWEF